MIAPNIRQRWVDAYLEAVKNKSYTELMSPENGMVKCESCSQWTDARKPCDYCGAQT